MRNLWMQGIIPVLGGLILWFLGGWSIWLDYDVATANDYTMWTVPGLHWQVGGAFVIAVAAAKNEPRGATDVALVLLGPFDDFHVSGTVLHVLESSMARFTART